MKSQENNFKPLKRLYVSLSDYPRCTDYFEAGMRKYPKSFAIGRRYIQLNRENYWCKYLSLDCDYPESCFAWKELDLPCPTFCATNRENGHCHIIYELANPIHLSSKSNPKPIAYLQAVENGYTDKFQADDSFPGLLSKNPLSPSWEVEPHDNSYSLDELAEPLRDVSWKELEKTPLKELESRIKTFRIPTPRKKEIDLDTDESLFVFNNARHFAYETVKHCSNLSQLHGKIKIYILNLTEKDISPSKLRADTKSISAWVWNRRFNLSKPNINFSKVQRLRAYKSNRVQKQNTHRKIKLAFRETRKQKIKPTQANISKISGVCLRTVKTHWHTVKA